MRGLRVLEIGSTVAGAYCGRLLATVGADVVCLEPAEGVALRDAPPWIDAGAGGERRSAAWEYLGAGKRSVTLGPDGDRDSLLRWADLVVSSTDGDPDSTMNLHRQLESVHPAAVHVALSGFGLTGPYRGWLHTPLTDWAAGGQMFITGEPDREPLQGGGPWASYVAGATAAVGAQAAVIHAARTGEGQLVDAGAMEALAAAHQWTITMYTHTGCVKQRWGNRFGESHHPMALYRCTDGWICLGAPGTVQWEALCLAVDAAELLVDERLYAPAERFDRADEIDAWINPWLAARSADEAVETLQEARVPAGRLQTLSEVLAEPHLGIRGYWATPEHLGGGARMPWLPFKLGQSPPEFGPAPGLGEHNDQVLTDAVAADRPSLPRIDLSTVRVAEFSVAWAGPLAGRFLGDLGADVIKVEHPLSRGLGVSAGDAASEWEWGALPDPQVRAGVFPDADPGERWWNRMGIFNKMNRSKRSLCLDAKVGDGPEVLARLLARCDVVLHNYTPRGARSLGIDAAAVADQNPRAVTVAMSGYGETGPLMTHSSWGPILQAHSGFDEATGYEGGGPTRIGIAFPDAVGGVHGAFATLAALWEREVIDGPVHVDVSQFETLLSLAGDMVLATSVTGEDPVRHGNRSHQYAPQGVYRCAGEDAWVAISVTGDGPWSHLVDVVGPVGKGAWRDASLERRFDAHDAIDDLITAWTSTRTPAEAARELQDAGLAAVPVMTNRDLVEDPQLAERRFIVTWDQPDVGQRAFPGFPLHLERTPARLRPCPALGADNADVVVGLLGYPPDEMARLVADGVVATEPTN